MDAKQRLRLYLEQRRELGERDLVLDQLPVDDVLALVGAKAAAGQSKRSAKNAEKPAAASSAASETPAAASGEASPPVVPQPPPTPAPRFDPNKSDGDWRSALRASGAEAHSTPAAAPRETIASEPSTPVAAPLPSWLQALALPTGISVGAAREGAVHKSLTSLDDVALAIAHCNACPLYETAIKHVPGEGNPNANFVCVGEAPGKDEDEAGRPFVGASGQLLTKILAAISLRREDIFICNVLKHRPPGNRNPTPSEIHACRPYLEQQLTLLRPRVILALGTFAAHTLLDTTQSLSALRGRLHLYHGVPLIVTYHPAALLRNESWKRPTWEDVQLARRIHDASLEATSA